MKKRLLFLLTLLLVVPFSAKGLTYELSEADSTKAGQTTFTIYVNSNSTNTNETDSLSCESTNNTTCKIVATNGNTMNDDQIKGDVQFLKPADDGTVKDKEEVGQIVVTNSSYDDVSATVIFKVAGTANKTIDGVKVLGSAKPKSSNAKLTELKTEVGSLSPSFNSDTYSYTLYGIPDSNRRFKFYYKCDNCSVTISGGVKTDKSSQEGYDGAWYVELNQGENAVEVKVTAEDGNSTSTYKINAIRGENGYGSAKLKSLTIGEYKFDPEFTSDTLEYKVSIPKKLSNISKLIQYEAEDKKATVEVKGADTLDNDENEVTITVTGQTGDKTIYKLTVVKEDEVQAVIDVIGYKDDKVTFIDTEGNSQTLSKEEFKTQYPDEWTKIENGEYKFDDDGNIIRDKSNTNSETNSNEKKKSSFPWLIVVLIILAIAVIAVSGYFIFRDPTKKKNKKGKGTEEEDKQEPTEEEKEHLEDIDSYNEEARLIAEDNIRNENDLLNEDTEDNTTVEEEPEEDKIDETGVEEEIVKTETIDDYADEEKSATTDIDEALSDLMNTKEYNFKDK